MIQKKMIDYLKMQNEEIIGKLGFVHKDLTQFFDKIIQRLNEIETNLINNQFEIFKELGLTEEQAKQKIYDLRNKLRYKTIKLFR